MKNLILVGTTLALAMAAGSAAAETGPTAGKFGLNVGLTSANSNFLIGGKYFIAKDMAVLAGVGLVVNDSGVAANSKSTDLGIQGGFRKYLKTDDLAPFVGGKLQYLSTRSGTGAGALDVTNIAIMAEGGAEYFLNKQFSLEGSVGFGYASSESKLASGGPTTKATSFGSTTYNVSANFYF